MSPTKLCTGLRGNRNGTTNFACGCCCLPACFRPTSPSPSRHTLSSLSSSSLPSTTTNSSNNQLTADQQQIVNSGRYLSAFPLNPTEPEKCQLAVTEEISSYGGCHFWTDGSRCQYGELPEDREDRRRFVLSLLSSHLTLFRISSNCILSFPLSGPGDVCCVWLLFTCFSTTFDTHDCICCFYGAIHPPIAILMCMMGETLTRCWTFVFVEFCFFLFIFHISMRLKLTLFL